MAGKLFGIPTTVIRGLALVVTMAVGLFFLSCYGKSKYNEGRDAAQTAHTDSVRKILTKAIDSVHNAMSPVLESILKENDKLKADARQARIAAASALGRAQRAEKVLADLPDSILKITPPEVIALIDSIKASSVDMRASLQRLAEQTIEIQAGKDSALAEAQHWKALEEQARAVIDTSAKEIRQLQAQKKPPRCGFKCGVVVGGTAALGIVITVVKLLGT